MGDYSSRCAITGLPITGSQKVVGLELEPYRWADSTGKNKYIPFGLPIIGEYDNGGGIEGYDIEGNLALIHWDVWQNAHIYWHSENRPYTKDWINPQKALDEANREMSAIAKALEAGCDLREGWNTSDYVYYHINKQFQNTCFGLVFREFEDGKDVSGRAENHSFLHRGKFMQLVVEKIINGWTEKFQNDLDKIISLWGGQMITGHFIRPSREIWLEQYPEYHQRIKTLEFSLSVAKKLQKAIDDFRDEDE